MTTTLGVGTLGVRPIAGQFAWGAITLTITSPLSQTSSTSLTATWSYSNSQGYPQTHYRVKLLTQSGSTLYDSDWTAGAGTSFFVPYTLSNLSRYTLEVTVRATDLNEQTATLSFLVIGANSLPAPEPLVGTIYEVGINGVGYMLMDLSSTEPQLKYQRQRVSLDSPRLATGDTPFNQAIERYGFFTWLNWTGGAGQFHADREDSSPSAFYDSDGVFPFDPGKLKLLNAVTSSADAAVLRGVVVGGDLYYHVGTNALKRKTDISAAATSFSVAAAGTISSLASDGTYWYAADGLNVYRNNAAADPGAAWSTQDAVEVGWAAGRLCAAVKGGGSSTPNIFTTLNSSGAEEVAGGRIVLPAGWTITSFTEGDGYVWFGAYQGNVGAIYAWQSGSAAAPALAMPLPFGEIPVSLFWYQGQVLVRVNRNGTPVIYRCPTSDGTATPFLLTELTGASTPGTFAGRGKYVYFSWSAMSGTSAGVGVLDLSTGGYARNVKGTYTGDVTSVVVWDGLVSFVVSGAGLVAENLSAWVTTGYLKTSIGDGGSALEKSFDELVIQASPLLTNQSATVEFSIDRGESYVAITNGVLSGAGNTRITVPIRANGPSIGLKVTLAGPGTSTPTLTLVQVQAHPLGLSDTVVVVPVNCFDEVRNLQGGIIDNVAGDGVRRARLLESLVQTKVTFQDVDWWVTGSTEAYEVISAQVVSYNMFDRHQGGLAVGYVVVLTLRSSGLPAGV